MKPLRWHDNPQGLEPLAAQAADYALHMMRTTGSVPPTAIAVTDDGLIFCMPDDLANEAAKDRFAEIARLLATAYCARALVMIVEAWATMPDANGHLDTNTPPSQSPNRREIVALMFEDRSHSATSLLPIIRDAGGKFIELESSGPIQFGESEGRFAGLMKGSAPTAEQSAKAKAVLQQLRLSVVNRGFDPTLN
jgi:hypothetical protein